MDKTREDYLEEFHKAFNQDVHSEPTVKLLTLRRTLIEEEVKELFSDMDIALAHLEKGEVVPREIYINMLKELTDVQVVLSGTSVALNPLKNLNEAFLRVFESNMSKLDDNGRPVFREDGKVLKGPNYFPPDLSDLVE